MITSDIHIHTNLSLCAKEDATLERYIEKDGVIEGFEIFVPTENGAIKPNYFSVFIHELTHAIHQ